MHSHLVYHKLNIFVYIQQQGGKMIDLSQSKSLPEIKDKVEIRNKPKAIEAPKDNRTTKLKSIFGFGKKKKKGTKDVGK